MVSKKARLGRPPDPRKREAILVAARDLFIEGGFDGMSMEETAARAVVSKVTVYKQFTSKEDLLEELVSLESERMEAGMARLSFTGDGALEQLSSFGFQLMSFFARPDVAAFDLRMMLEGRRNKALVRMFMREGPARLYAVLAGFFREQGIAAPDETDQAAAQLIALWRAAIPVQVQFGQKPPLASQELQTRVASATKRFLRAWPPRREHGN